MPQFRHGRGTRILVDDADLSTYFRDATAASSADAPETTHFGSTVKTYVIGMTDGRLSLGGMFSGDQNGVDEYFQTIFGREAGCIVTYAPEGLAPGRRCWGFMAHESSYQINGSVSDIVAVSAEFQATAGLRSGVSLADPGTPVTATGMGTAQDTGIPTSDAGGWATMHVLGNDGTTGDVTVAIQHSNSLAGTYVDLATFDAVAAEDLGALRVDVPVGTVVNRYVRASYTFAAAGGTFSAHINFTRNVLL